MINKINTGATAFDYKIEQQAQTKDVATIPKKDIMAHNESTQRINANQVIAYYPNVKVLSPQEKFEKALEHCSKLSDGSIILKPMILGSSHHITNSCEEGTYIVESTGSAMGSKTEVSLLTEKELLEAEHLVAGTAKPLDDGTYDVTYMIEAEDGSKEKFPITINLDSKGLRNFLSLEHMTL